MFASFKCSSRESILLHKSHEKKKTEKQAFIKKISGMLHTKRLLTNDNGHEFEITKEMRKRMNSDMYKKTLNRKQPLIALMMIMRLMNNIYCYAYLADLS